MGAEHRLRATELSWISLKMTGRVTTFASILEMMATAARKADRVAHIGTGRDVVFH